MGMQAAYMLVDEETLDRLVSLPSDELSPAIEALEASGAPTVHLDKMWDGLHFLLTGVPASAPKEGDPLSEAVVGVHVFDGDDFVGCTELDELPAILRALQETPLKRLLATADFIRFSAAEVYPNIWSDDPETLRAELSVAFQALLDVHQRAADARRHLVISIL